MLSTRYTFGLALQDYAASYPSLFEQFVPVAAREAPTLCSGIYMPRAERLQKVLSSLIQQLSGI